MSESLGKCVVCGEEASVLYPLLPSEPVFCSEHHNSKDAGLFGCDFTGPDDFDVPFDDDDVPFHTQKSSKPQKLSRGTFVWRDKEGNRYLLSDIDDVYLRNIINFLKRGEGHVAYESTERRKVVIEFLEKELRVRR